MSQTFQPGDYLIFQLESGYGVLRVLASEGERAERVWHLLAYDEFFPTVEAADGALADGRGFTVRKPHMALTERAFERTPVSRLGTRPVTEEEMAPYLNWLHSENKDVSDRSALLLLGIR